MSHSSKKKICSTDERDESKYMGSPNVHRRPSSVTLDDIPFNATWFWHRTDRKMAEEKLLQQKSDKSYLNEDGSFLVRKSSIRNGYYALSVKRGKVVLHYIIYQKPDKRNYFIYENRA
ncbi:hypothetical protein ACOME3_008513 [Neoechinorhynchus agilis]